MNDPGFEIVRVAGERALAEQDRLRNLFPQTGLYPVMLGQEAQIEELLYDLTPENKNQITLDKSYQIEMPLWFRQREAEEEANIVKPNFD